MSEEEFRENLLQLVSAQYVQLARIYDFLIVIADKVGVDSVALTEEHLQGKLIGPEPFLDLEEKDEQS